jgi:hypothetical protein
MGCAKVVSCLVLLLHKLPGCICAGQLPKNKKGVQKNKAYHSFVEKYNTIKKGRLQRQTP